MTRRVHRLLVCWIALLSLTAAAASAGASTKWSDQALAELSEAIVIGRVDAALSAWEPNGEIYTYVHLDVSDVLKGRLAPGRLTLKQLGGTVGDTTLTVAGQPAFSPGEEVLLFLEIRPRDRTLYTAALWQGKWTFERTGSGARVAVQRLPGLSPHLGGEEILVESRAEDPWLEAVRAWAARSASSDPGSGPNTHPAEAPAAWEGPGGVPFIINAPPARYHQADMGTPVPVDFQGGGQPGLVGGGLAEINNAMSLWNGAGSSLVLAQGVARGPRCSSSGEPADSRISISFMDPCGEVSDAGLTLDIVSVLSVTDLRVVSGISFRRIARSVIVLNNSAMALARLTRNRCFQDTVTRALGRAFGLGFSNVPNQMMSAFQDPACLNFPVTDGSEGEPITGVLGNDDILGIRTIHPGMGGPPPPPPPPGMAPPAPTNLQVQVNGLNVQLTWDASAGATSYVLQAGTAALVANLFNQNIGNVTQFGGAGPANLVIFAWVLAQNQFGTSGPSNVVMFGPLAPGGPGPGPGPGPNPVPPCSTPPNPPRNVLVRVAGTRVTVSWDIPQRDRDPATSYRITAGTSDLVRNNIVDQNVGDITAVSADAIPGTYFGNVFALNACGSSAPAPFVAIVV
jgi:hypothetical protein